MFVYRVILDDLKLKKDKGTYYVLIGNHREYILLSLSFYILLSYIASNFLNVEWD